MYWATKLSVQTDRKGKENGLYNSVGDDSTKLTNHSVYSVRALCKYIIYLLEHSWFFSKIHLFPYGTESVYW